MKDLAIYGAGGFGREVYCSIRNNGFKEYGWNFIGFFDDVIAHETSVFGYGKVLGGYTTLNSWKTPICVLFAFGDASIAHHVVGKLNNSLIEYPNYITQANYFVDKSSFNIGKGNLLVGCNKFSCNVTIGDFNVFNSDDVLGHDVQMGSFNSLMPGVRVSGGVLMGDFNFFGAGSIILQKIRIKDNTTLGAGSVLMTNPKENELYLGVPAKIFKY